MLLYLGFQRRYFKVLLLYILRITHDPRVGSISGDELDDLSCKISRIWGFRKELPIYI
jgi:hypothetical protein